MNERTKLTRIIVKTIESFPKVHKFLTSGDTDCHPQYLVNTIVKNILDEYDITKKATDDKTKS